MTLAMKISIFLSEKSQESFESTASLFRVSEKQTCLFDLSNSSDQGALQKLIDEDKIRYVKDDYEEQIKEYFQITNPENVFSPDFENRFLSFFKKLKEHSPLWQMGRWVYFPWKATIVHILDESAFQMVRTARNRHLISPEEQTQFYNSVIGVAGLSVGNSIALTIILQGGARHIKLADNDTLALSNTNRIRTSIENLGLAKAEMTARQIYEINPYAKVEIFSAGLDEKNIEEFFTGSVKLDLIIDEIDNLGVKYLIREQARKYRVPLLMAVDNGENGIIDIERYDISADTPFFHNRMGEVSYEKLNGLKKMEIGEMIARHVGPENVSERMRNSLLEIGKTIVSWPQLGSAALLNSSAVAYCARKILTHQPLADNRVIISFEDLFKID